MSYCMMRHHKKLTHTNTFWISPSLAERKATTKKRKKRVSIEPKQQLLQSNRLIFSIPETLVDLSAAFNASKPMNETTRKLTINTCFFLAWVYKRICVILSQWFVVQKQNACIHLTLCREIKSAGTNATNICSNLVLLFIRRKGTKQEIHERKGKRHNDAYIHTYAVSLFYFRFNSAQSKRKVMKDAKHKMSVPKGTEQYQPSIHVFKHTVNMPKKTHFTTLHYTHYYVCAAYYAAWSFHCM